MTNVDVQLLYDKIKSLNELLWENRAQLPVVNQWLDNFVGHQASVEKERKHALYLLSKFLYFGQVEVRQLLRAMFNDLIRHPLTMALRTTLPQQDDFATLKQKVHDEVNRTRFLGLGGAAESGPHLLYDFRIANQLTVDICMNLQDLVIGSLDNPQSRWSSSDVHRLVFIDDFCGTGNQATQMGRDTVPLLRDVANRSGVRVEVWYLTLIATTHGLERLRTQGFFDRVESVSELDETYRVFDSASQVYANGPADLPVREAESIARYYGARLCPGQPLGYRDSQLLLGFRHNVPDNTLPIMSRERLDIPWHAIFPRSEKT